MKILFLSNFYPPASRGGYEEWCQEVAQGLRNRGHEVVVLTSVHGRESLRNPEPAWIHRELQLEMELASLRNALQFFTRRKTRERENLNLLQQYVTDFFPDVILVWGMWNLPRALPAFAEKLLPGRVVYYMGDYWPTLPDQFELYWQAPARSLMTAIPKSILKPIARRMLAREERPSLCFDHVLFPSAFMRDEFQRKGVKLRNTKVIYGAIDTRMYQGLNDSSTRQQNGNLSLLYLGRLTTEKGVHTAIEALGLLVRRHGLHHLTLTIVGNGEPQYEFQLRELARRENVEGLVRFMEAQPKETLPLLYQQADVFLFTSIWPEPFGRVIVEAMASGVVVVGTSAGGSAEILSENENALVFFPGDSMGLAEQIKRLADSPPLRQQLSKAARATALAKFDIQRMTVEIEKYLWSLIQ